jgi:hypothetical protein
MGITEEIRGECGETYRRMSAKGAPQFVVRAPLRLSVTQLDIAVVGGTYLAGFWRGDQGKAMRRSLTRQALPA